MLIFKGLNLSETFQSVLKGVVLFLLSLSSSFFLFSLLLNWKKKRKKEKVLEREAEL